jgi:hypothetical protein
MHGGKDWVAITPLVPGRNEICVVTDGRMSWILEGNCRAGSGWNETKGSQEMEVHFRGRTRRSQEGAIFGAGSSLPLTHDEFVA